MITTIIINQFLSKHSKINDRFVGYVIREQYLKTSSRLTQAPTIKKGENHDEDSGKRIEKPNLRAAGANMNSSTSVIILMGLGFLCMYPLVFRPMLFSEELGEFLFAQSI